MGDVKAWAVALCGAAVACAALQMLAPKGSMGKLFRMIVGAFFLCCLISPLLSLKTSLKPKIGDALDIPSTTSLEEQVQQQVNRQTQAALLAYCRKLTANYDVTIKNVSVKTDTSDDSSIYISQVIVTLDKQSAKSALTVKQLLTQQLGTEVSVVEDDR